MFGSRKIKELERRLREAYTDLEKADKEKSSLEKKLAASTSEVSEPAAASRCQGPYRRGRNRCKAT